MAGLLSSGMVNAGLLGPLVAQATVGARRGLAPIAQAPVVPAIPGPADRGQLRTALDFILGGREGVEYERTRPMREATARQRMVATQNLNSLFLGGGSVGGSPAPAPGGLLPGASAPSGGGLLSPASGASAPTGGRLPSLQQAAPILAAAQLAGIEGVDGLLDILKDSRQEVRFENGVAYDPYATAPGTKVGVQLANNGQFAYDQNDPDNANRFFPGFRDGEAPVFDNGQIVGVQNMPGSVRALAETTRATNDATNASEASYAGVIAGNKAAGEAPYAVETVQGPNGPVTMSRADMLASGPIVGTDTATINARETRNEDDFDLAEGAESIAGRFAGIRQQLANGTFDLNPVKVAEYETVLRAGGSDPAAVAYGNYRSTIQQAVNDSLRLNKGVQTEGDAQREAAGILRNINNRAYVVERLGTLEGINARAAAQRRARIDRRGGEGGIVTVSSPEQARALPPGTRFRTANGQIRTRN